MGKTRYGTSYFDCRDAAEEYYRDAYRDVRTAVIRKLDAGEIHLGPPPNRKGFRAVLHREEQRWFMEEV